MNNEEYLISLVCIEEMENEYIQDFIEKQGYDNFEIVRLESEDKLTDLIPYFQNTDSRYTIFLEKDTLYHKQKVREAIEYMEKMKTDIVIIPRLYTEDMKTCMVYPGRNYRDTFLDTIFCGMQFVQYCIENKINLYGNLSCLMVLTDYLKNIDWDIPDSTEQRINKLYLLMNILLQGKLSVSPNPYVSTLLKKEREIDKKEYDHYKEWITGKLNISKKQMNTWENLKKEITFFATDQCEYSNLLPISLEAEKRGYVTKFTDNVQEKAEIGIYCQHECYPENSKFSMILLHDMTQGHGRWPNIWEVERWDKFDVGILPGYDWGERWSRCAFMDYARAKKGIYILGYPKADNLYSKEIELKAKELKNRWNFMYDKTVLYAPSWEFDEKEEDFVKALSTLPVNLLIKQRSWSQSYAPIIENINKMRKQHEGHYNNLYYMEPEDNINIALSICDLVVSDESSVMTEALLYGKPSIAVMDWLIPDSNPPRKSSVPINYVTKCIKVQLREYVENFLKENSTNSVKDLAGYIFANKGNCCSDILDCIDYYVLGEGRSDFMQKKVDSIYGNSDMYK